MDELDTIVLRQGEMGKCVEECQKKLAKAEENEIRVNGAFKSKVSQVKFQMGFCSNVTNLWLTRGSGLVTLQPCAVSISQVSPQSCTVERVCKAHNLIHCKARNRLLLPVVKMLLYCYVNLRMLNKCEADLGEFLVDALDEEDIDEEEGAAAAPATAAAAAEGSA